MQLAPSLHRIGSDYVNVYLVADETGVTVVDAGLSGLWKEFLAELLAMGRELADVRAVLLTHGDSDHIVTLSDAQKAVERLPDAELVLRPEESHLGGFAAADEVLTFVRESL